MAEKIRIGTYNVENLFDRFDDPYSFQDDPWQYKSSKPKKLKDLYELGSRIRASDVDLLALQEIENYGALRDFVQGNVGKKYKTQDGIVSVQSNDPRGIDLGLLSKLPVGRVISHRHIRLGRTNKKFSRDCLEIEILKKDRSGILLTLYICHLKSKYSKFNPVSEPEKYKEDQKKSAEKRKLEVSEIINIVSSTRDVDRDLFVICGDMNDTPESDALSGFLGDENKLKLTNATDVLDTSDFQGSFRKRRKRDTHKWSRKGDDGKSLTTFSQIDFILCSKSLWKKSNGKVKVEHRGNTSGSDHYLSYAEFEI